MMDISKLTTGYLWWKKFAVVINNGEKKEIWECENSQNQDALMDVLQKLFAAVPAGITKICFGFPTWHEPQIL